MDLNYFDQKSLDNIGTMHGRFYSFLRKSFHALRWRLYKRRFTNNQINDAHIAFLLGGQKCGTSSLYTYLMNHQQISKSIFKEPHYFNLNFFTKDYSWYRANYDYSLDKKLVIDATPDYFTNSLLPIRIKNVYPNAKFIIYLREPLSRIKSQYKMEYHRGTEVRIFKDAIMLDELITKEINYNIDLVGRGNEIDNQYLYGGYINRSEYAKYLTLWFQHFPRENFFIGFFEDLKKNSQLEIDKIQSFLGLEHESIDTSIITNSGKKRDDILFDNETISYLEKHFSSENKKLRNLLGLQPKR